MYLLYLSLCLSSLALMPIRPLLTILRLLHCRAATVSTGDILLFLRFGLHLVIVGLLLPALAKVYASLEDTLKIVFHNS